MEKTYSPNTIEGTIYSLWDKGGYFTPRIDKTKKPFTIILPLPNASDPMHMGHALFTVEDIMVRFHRMKGDPTLWLPGGDHAGIETQFVFEKKLAKEGKSRFDFDRETLYAMISEFVDTNKNINRDQMKRLGFSMDWTRYHYSLEPAIVQRVIETFIKLYKEGYVYRSVRMVNYCVKCGTAFSDLEVNHEERDDFLYYLDYGPIRIATARPETIFADVAVAVHPQDKRYASLIGKNATVPLIEKGIPIITDESIQIDFGTGALKVTPAHAPEDYEIGLQHHLPIASCINYKTGRLEGPDVPEKYRGMKILAARKQIVEDLGARLLETKPLHHTVSTCYRCGSLIEPVLLPQWFIKTKDLAKPAIEAVKTGKTKIVPLERFEKLYFDWMDNIKDWNVSRQIVWGPRLPVWYRVDGNEDRIWVTFIDETKKLHQGTIQQHASQNISIETMEHGVQQIEVPLSEDTTKNPEIFVGVERPKSGVWIQETDTFDTWFLSGQWPVSTLKTKEADFAYFYPTSVLDTLWDILFFWVARMMMLGIYLTGNVPFEVVHLHSRVVDNQGRKMSKSKGNVVNPIEMVDKYGADALRMALVFGAAPGSDIVMSEDKVRGMRNFANKLWNIGRLYLLNTERMQGAIPPFNPSIHEKLSSQDQEIIENTHALITTVTDEIERYRFSDAAQATYEFTWHVFADKYLEENKERFQLGDTSALSVYRYVFLVLLKLLHPFMPFVTEAIWQQITEKHQEPLIISPWPTV